jgi:hypothetical protein
LPFHTHRDQLGGKLASSWQKEAASAVGSNPTDSSTSSSGNESGDANESSSSRLRREEIVSNLVGKLLRRPSVNSLRRRHILVDGDPTFHARKMALKHLLIERTLNDQLAKKYESSIPKSEDLPMIGHESFLGAVNLEGM